MVTETSSAAASTSVAVLAPNPLLGVTIEPHGSNGDEVHVHPGGQGVWLTRMAGELGAEPVLCGLCGGEAGAVLRSLLEALPGQRRLVEAGGASGCYVIDRRSGERQLVGQSVAPTPPATSSTTCSPSPARPLCKARCLPYAIRIRATRFRSRCTET